MEAQWDGGNKKWFEGRPVTDEDLDLLKVTLDLPGHVLADLKSARLASFELMALLVFSLVAFVIALMPIGFFVYSGGFADSIARNLFAGSDVILIRLHLVSPVIGLVGGLFLAGFLAASIPLLGGDAWTRAVMARGLIESVIISMSYPRFVSGLIRGAARKIPHHLYGLDYLKALAGRFVWRIGVPTFLILLLTFGLFYLELTNATRVSRDGITIAAPYSVSSRSYGWGEVREVGTGCSRAGTSGRMSSSYSVLHYVLEFEDGKKVNIGNRVMPIGVNFIEALEFIDNQVRERSVPRKVATYFTGAAKGYDRRCLGTQKWRYGEEGFRRLQRVLVPY